MERTKGSAREISPDTATPDSSIPALAPDDRVDLDRRLREAARILAKGVVRAAMAARTNEKEASDEALPQ